MANIKVKQEIGGDLVYAKGIEGGEQVSADITRVWTAKGYGWKVMATSAVASLIVRPTVTAIATFYNNTAKNFVIETVFTHNLVSIANGNFSIWVCIHPTGMTAPTNDITVRSSTIGLAAGTEGIFDAGATVVDNGWFPVGMWGTTVTATMPGTSVEAEIKGRLIVPPTAAISLSAVAQTAVVTQCMGIHYFSVPTTEFKLG
uniref:Uncharacterized protein n=1 Tax=viral metagenome TaxID=1070528 RepID=A0A6H1ZXF4_9ZZZZ